MSEERMGTASHLHHGRAAFDRGEWAAAYTVLSAADHETELAPEDLERLATAAYLTGHDADSDEILARAQQAWLSGGELPRAARCSVWLGFQCLLRGEEALSSGWMSKAQRLLDQCDPNCAERGYLLVWTGLTALDRDPMSAHADFAEAGRIGFRHHELDLVTLSQLFRARALIRAGRTTEGVSLLDEAMVAVSTHDVSTRVAGIVYCGVLEECQIVFDLRRARQWTSVLTRWCDAQPDLVPYRGQCLVHRAELMQLQGDWPGAIDEAARACQLLAGHPAAAAAYYQLAELHRLRGEFAPAEDAYLEASRRGHPPQPGLALVRMAQGRVGAAAAAMRTVVDGVRARGRLADPLRGDHVTRSRLLSAHVDVLLAARDVTGARGAADELAEFARVLEAPFLLAVSAYADGAVCLAEGKARAAWAALRAAWTIWRDIDAPYEAARVRVLMGLACRELGDHDGAALELDAARWSFHQLGAVWDVSRVEKLSVLGHVDSASLLTPREIDVLRLIALGKSNREIAADLVLSEKTVARHVSNILTKLQLGSRSAATAYAYQRGLA
jgi:DNA-binding CsgD family transcriptional regulator